MKKILYLILIVISFISCDSIDYQIEPINRNNIIVLDSIDINDTTIIDTTGIK